MRRRAAALALVTVVACYPTTTRPHFTPPPNAAVLIVELFVPQATREVAIALDADSIPVRRTEPADGWLESEWFDIRTMRRTPRRHLGLEVVKVRAFIDPDKANHSAVMIETVHIPVADPSRDERSLERQVPATHPIAIRVAGIVNRLTRQFGEPSITADPVPAPAVPPESVAPAADTKQPTKPTKP